MPDGQVLEFTRVTKRFNEVTAVSDLSARVEPGAVTAFLGPNGAGKTTTLRILLGQVRPTSGTATIGGTPFSELRQPLRTIGSVLEETAYRPRRTASRQLTIAAKANGIPLSRVDQVLAEVGLEGEGDSRIGGFSLGMRQRLSVAHALLGDPGALVFDEPANGLDPEGIRWMRLLMRRLADEGRTVLVSSHVLSEVEQVADNVLVLSKGELVLSSGIETLADPAAGSVVVDAADRAGLTAALSTAGFDVEVLRSGLTVRGGDAGTVGAVAAAAGIALSTLVQRGPTLEDVFIDLVRGGKLEARASAAASQLALPRSIAGLPVAAAPVEVPASAAEATSDSAVPEVDVAERPPAETNGAETDDDAASTEADIAVAEEDAMFAEIASVSAALSETAPTDPVSAAAIAANDDDPFAPLLDDAGSEETGDEDAAAAAAVAEAEAADDAVIDVLAHSDSTDVSAAPAPSFDEILFGTATPASDESDASDEFEATTDVAASDESTEEADPRSAAVSSMLAAAARAYYEDEPKDYPLGADQSPDESGTWSVASTGVIDTVPAPTSDGESENQGEQHDHHDGEHHHDHHDGEHHQNHHD